MNSPDNIQNELRDLNSGLPSPGSGPFSVPEGYFDGLAGSILAKIKGETPLSAAAEIATLSPLLAGISRSMPYHIPAQYFEKGLDEVPFLIGEDPQSAILSLVERVTPYEVPTGYFAGLPEQVLEKVASKGKRVPLSERRWMKLAVAAMVTGIICLTGYFYVSHKAGVTANQPIAQQLKNVSTKELDEFIKTADISSTSTETAKNKTVSPVEVERLLNDVSDKELDAFLNQVPTDDEDLLAIN